MFPYSENLLFPKKRKSRAVQVGDLYIGGDYPVVIQSMTTTPTKDTMATVDQIEKLVDSGCQLVRITTPTVADVENTELIRAEMLRRKLNVPLVADVHFQPKIALKACELFEKIRINPGNFADRKRFENKEYSDAEYALELDRIQEDVLPLVKKAKEYGRAIRIGTNHGSLSDRIMNRFGDTPLGMVESALEFIRIFEAESFHNIVISMKSSNPLVMIQAYRLLVAKMNEIGMDYPLHLGVTEAGEGEDGRVKSAIGIGSLLSDGLGDTIRVSLTEDPEREIPVADELAKLYQKDLESSLDKKRPHIIPPWNLYEYSKRICDPKYLKDLGGQKKVKVTGRISSVFDLEILFAESNECDVDRVFIENTFQWNAKVSDLTKDIPVCLRLNGESQKVEPALLGEVSEMSLRINEVIVEPRYFSKLIEKWGNKFIWLRIEHFSDLDRLKAINLSSLKNGFGIEVYSNDLIPITRALATVLEEKKITAPLHLSYRVTETYDKEQTVLAASVELGSLLCDGMGDLISIDNQKLGALESQALAFTVLQSTRLRMSRADFIACPSCGRTLFDLQDTTAKIKEKTAHLKGVKIAIMGCIVNGPGEMADADFGYVGSGPGKINLYVGKDCVKRHVDESDAGDELISLIKEHGQWLEPKAL